MLAAPKARPKLTIELQSELATMHSVRNNFVHGGADVSRIEVDRAIDNARTLAEHVRMPGNMNLVGVPTAG